MYILHTDNNTCTGDTHVVYKYAKKLTNRISCNCGQRRGTSGLPRVRDFLQEQLLECFPRRNQLQKKWSQHGSSRVGYGKETRLLLPLDHSVQESLKRTLEIVDALLLESCDLRLDEFRHLFKLLLRIQCTPLCLCTRIRPCTSTKRWNI